jgi:hypothetical protein
MYASLFFAELFTQALPSFFFFRFSKNLNISMVLPPSEGKHNATERYRFCSMEDKSRLEKGLQ